MGAGSGVVYFVPQGMSDADAAPAGAFSDTAQMVYDLTPKSAARLVPTSPCEGGTSPGGEERVCRGEIHRAARSLHLSSKRRLIPAPCGDSIR